MKTNVVITLAAICVAAAEFVAPAAHREQPAVQAAEKKTNPDDWLLNAPDDEARFKLLQSQARGFSASMFA
jgi:hypothetical protein